MTFGTITVDDSIPDGCLSAIENRSLRLLKKKSPTTYIHCMRAAMIAEQFGLFLNLDVIQQEQLVKGCRLHDIGKLFVPESILQYSGKLTARDWTILKLHPVCGSHLLEDGNGEAGGAVWDIVMHHHERWDGRGYPDRLADIEIPYLARICSIIDAFDSMTSDRCYRKGMPHDEAIQELERHRCTQFDPILAQHFVEFARQPGFPSLFGRLPAAI